MTDVLDQAPELFPAGAPAVPRNPPAAAAEPGNTGGPAAPEHLPAAPATGIPAAEIAALRAAYDADPLARVATNALSRTPLKDVALNRAVTTSVDHSFSVVVDDEWVTTNQRETGRCWIFAALNLFRARARTKLAVTDLQLSQSYVSFWDKLERANWFLTTVAETATTYDDGDRTLDQLLTAPLEDAGQWDMLVNVVRKHGVVPTAVMPDTCGAADTRAMNGLLYRWLRHGAVTLRAMVRAGAAADEVDATRRQLLGTVHRILTGVLGVPPADFDWQWTDSAGEFTRVGRLTGTEFFDRYVDLPLEDYVCLVNDPRNAYGQTYTVDRLGNLVGGRDVRYLNVRMDVLARAAADTLQAGEPVWFGCDASKMWRQDVGVLDPAVYDYGSLFGFPGVTVPADRRQRLQSRDSQLTHAMLLTGVDLVDGDPRRWRVEDSYGPEPGRKGFHVMTQGWFDEYLYEVVIRRDRLPAEVAAGLDTTPVVLPLWDPMGALAR